MTRKTKILFVLYVSLVLVICPAGLAQAETPTPTPTPNMTPTPTPTTFADAVVSRLGGSKVGGQATPTPDPDGLPVGFGTPLPPSDVITAKNASRLHLVARYDAKTGTGVLLRPFWRNGELWGTEILTEDNIWLECNLEVGECYEDTIDTSSKWIWTTLDEQGNLYLAYINDNQLHVETPNGDNIIDPLSIGGKVIRGATFFRIFDGYLLYSLTGGTYVLNLDTKRQWFYPGVMINANIGDTRFLLETDRGDSIVNITDGTVIFRLKRSNPYERYLAMSPDGNLVALFNDMRDTIRIIDPYYQRELAEWQSFATAWLHAIVPETFSQDGDVLLLRGRSSFALVDTWTGQVFTSFSTEYKHYISRAAFSPDGKYLVVETYTHGEYENPDDDYFYINVYGVPPRPPIRCTGCRMD